MNELHSFLLIVVLAVVTLGLRGLPFLIFTGGRKTPEIVVYLSKVLPYAIMGMLVVFCFKDTVITSFPYAAPEILAAALVVVLHIWKRNTLLSIVSGTLCYMILVQTVFVR